MNRPTLERYDHASESFIPYSEAVVVTVIDDVLFKGKWPEAPEGSPVVIATNMYDIPATMIAALRNLNRLYPGSSAFVYQSPPKLEKIAKAQTGINLIATTVHPADEVEDVPKWQNEFARNAFAAGCIGAVVNFDCVELAREFPDREFYRVVQTEAVK